MVTQLFSSLRRSPSPQHWGPQGGWAGQEAQPGPAHPLAYMARPTGSFLNAVRDTAGQSGGLHSVGNGLQIHCDKSGEEHLLIFIAF